MDGTSLRVVKRALLDRLTTVTTVSYQSPMQPEDMLGEDGSGVAAWWSDDSEASVKVVVATGGPHWFDETINATVIIQALGRDTDDTQEVCDTRATETLGEIIAVMAHDPSCGVADTEEMQLYTVTPAGWRNVTGILGPNLRAARYELDVTIHARIRLDTP